MDRIVLDHDRRLDAQQLVDAVQKDFILIDALRNPADFTPHGLFCPRDHLVGEYAPAVIAKSVEKRVQPAIDNLRGRKHRVEIALDDVGLAHVLPDEIERGRVRVAILEQLHPGNLQALLEDFPRRG